MNLAETLRGAARCLDVQGVVSWGAVSSTYKKALYSTVTDSAHGLYFTAHDRSVPVMPLDPANAIRACAPEHLSPKDWSAAVAACLPLTRQYFALTEFYRTGDGAVRVLNDAADVLSARIDVAAAP